MMKTLIEAKFYELNLDDMLSTLGEDITKSILSSFSCDLNPDVENFLKSKAILFSKSGFAKTYLIFWKTDNETFGKTKIELVGYFSIAQKPITIPRSFDNKKISSESWRLLCKIANEKSSANECRLSAILIGQLGKNYTNGNNLLISGNDLLGMALKKVKEAQKIIGGKITYLECEKIENVVNFYKRNDFIIFGERKLEGDETDLKGSSLLQLYKYIK